MAIFDYNGNSIGINVESGNIVTVAASNSSLTAKAAADYVCTGTNDQTIIQTAIDTLATTGGVVRFAIGDYHIDGWSVNTASIKTAIAIKNGTQRAIKLECDVPPIRRKDSHDLTNAAIFRVSSTALGLLTGNEDRVSVFGHNQISTRVYPSFIMDVKNVGIVLADNQHNVIGVDGKYFSAMFVENVMLAINTSTYDGVNGADDYDYPVVGCVGIRGLDGSNFGAGYRISNCFVFGFGVAYDLNGEHLIAEQLACRFCNYSYRFGYDNTLGANLHDLTLINCCHEFCSRYPYFAGGASAKQAINFYDYNVEDDNQSQFKTIARATEETNGNYRGRVYYTIVATSAWANIDRAFFADGSGSNFIVQNTAYPSV